MDFETLKELVATINRNKVKSVEVLGNPENKGGRTEDLYKSIANGSFNSDAEAAAHFFGSPNPRNPNYQRLRNKLIRQLVNTAFFVDVNKPMFIDRAKAHYQCYSDFAAANILALRNAKKAAAEVMEDVFRRAVRYEFTDLCVESVRFLQKHYGRALLTPHLHKKYSNLVHHYQQKQLAESKATQYFEEMVHYYIVKRAPDEAIHKMAGQYYDELAKLTKDADTALFNLRLCQVNIIKFLSKNDFSSALNLCAEYLEAFDQNANVGRDMKISIAVQKILCLIYLRRFDDDEAEKTVEYCLSLSEDGNYNWFRIIELQVQYLLKAGRYKEALDVFAKAIAHPRYESLNTNVRDVWRMFGGYFHLLAALGKLTEAEVVRVAGPFRYGRFMNEIELLDQDKAGRNVALVLLPVLFELAKGGGYVTDLTPENLEMYRWRYLRGAFHTRSNCFVRLLLALLKSPMDPNPPVHKIKKLLADLKATPEKPERDASPGEIISYEELWAMLTEGARGMS